MTLARHLKTCSTPSRRRCPGLGVASRGKPAAIKLHRVRLRQGSVNPARRPLAAPRRRNSTAGTKNGNSGPAGRRSGSRFCQYPHPDCRLWRTPAEPHRQSGPATLPELEEIREAANRGARLTSQLLDFTRGLPPQPQPIGLNVIAARHRTHATPHYRRRSSRVADFASAKPPASSGR